MSEVSEVVMGAAVIRAYGAEARSARQLEEAIAAQYRDEMRAAKYFALMFPMSDLFSGLALTAVIVAGAWVGGVDWGLDVGTMTRSPSGSPAITVHAFAPPVRWAPAPAHVDHPPSRRSWGTGSQVQREAPVRASKPRTSPLAASTRRLSETAEPTTTTSPTTVGGELER